MTGTTGRAAWARPEHIIERHITDQRGIDQRSINERSIGLHSIERDRIPAGRAFTACERCGSGRERAAR
jgi:hypothetical protein